MIFYFRMKTERRYEMMQRALVESRHQTLYEPPPRLGARQSDAEFLSLGLAEKFGVRPPSEHRMAFLIPNELIMHLPSFIITGVTFPSPPTAEEEIITLFSSIVKCVTKHNDAHVRQIITVGMAEDYLLLDRINIRNVIHILTGEVGL